MATLAGDSGYGCVMSTTIAGAAGSETPSGDLVYFWAEEMEILEKSDDRRRVMSNYTTSQLPTGKYDQGFKLSKVIVTKQAQATAGAEVDVIRNFIRDHSIKVGGTRVYGFLYNFAESRYQLLDWNATHTQIRPFYGRPQPTNWKMGKGKIYTASSFTFLKVTLD